METTNIKEHSGSKYLKTIIDATNGNTCLVDIYAVLEAFQVTCGPTQHAIKKLLMAGQRGKGDKLQDLREAIDSISRAIELEKSRQKFNEEKVLAFPGGSGMVETPKRNCVPCKKQPLFKVECIDTSGITVSGLTLQNIYPVIEENKRGLTYVIIDDNNIEQSYYISRFKKC